jgi:hypothetical protein
MLDSSSLIVDCQFSRRTERALLANGIATVGDLVLKTEDDLLALKGLGVACVGEIKSELMAWGMWLADSMRVEASSSVNEEDKTGDPCPCCGICVNRRGNECHGGIPQIHIRQFGDKIEHFGWWPVVSDDGWCGQFKAKEGT